MLSNFKNDGILHIASNPWRANISLYKNVVAARIILYNTYSTLSLTVANNQITSLCTQILIQNGVMVLYGSKIDQGGRNCSLITSAFSPSNYRNRKTLMFSFGMKSCIDPLVGEAKLLTRLGEKCTCNYWNCQYGCISEKNFGILVNRWCVFLSTILLQNESVRSLMHPAIVLNCQPRKS